MLPYDERRERVLKTAARIFAEKGYHSTTMRDLSRAMEMSLAGIYHYVKGKDELLYLIQLHCFTQMLEGARAALAGVADPRDSLERFIRHHITFFAGHMSEMKVLSHEAESLTGEHLEAVNALKRQYVALLTDLVLDAGAGREGEIDASVAAYALFGMINWIYNWYDPAGPVSPDALAEQFARLFLTGLLAPAPAPVSPGG